MRSPSASFILVSSADSVGIEAAKSVAAEVAARDFELTCVVFNRAFITGIDPVDRGPVTYPGSLAALAPKLERMRAFVAKEQERKRSDIGAFCKEHRARPWALPEATRPLGDTSALAAWIERGRPVDALA
jgi:hypothetical protein